MINREGNEMPIQVKRASLDNVSTLIKYRIELLRSANGLASDFDMGTLEAPLREYYETALASGEHIAYLAFDDDEFVGTVGACFYRVLPTWHNPTGKKAYLINLYVVPERRREGIGRMLVKKIVQAVLDEGVKFITLEATKKGYSLYEELGFAFMTSEMQLKNETFDDPLHLPE